MQSNAVALGIAGKGLFRVSVAHTSAAPADDAGAVAMPPTLKPRHWISRITCRHLIRDTGPLGP